MTIDVTANTDTDNVDDVEAVETVVVNDDVVDVEKLIAERDAAIADATKQRSIKQKIAKERDSLKQTPATDTDTANDVKYKALWEQSQTELETIRTSSRETQLSAALTEQLSKSGIKADALVAGRKLVDRSMIEFNDDGSIDDMSVVGAMQALRAESPFLFESKIAPTSTKTPAASNTASNEITRSEFDALSPVQKSEAMRAGKSVV